MLELELCWLLIDCAEEVFLSQKGESTVWGCPFSCSLALLRKKWDGLNTAHFGKVPAQDRPAIRSFVVGGFILSRATKFNTKIPTRLLAMMRCLSNFGTLLLSNLARKKKL